MGGSSAGGGGFNEMFRAGGHRGGRFQRGGGAGEDRMGKVGYIGKWSMGGHPDDDYRMILIGSVLNKDPENSVGGGRIKAYEERESGFLTVGITSPIPRNRRREGIGMGMYLAGLKYAKDNNLGFRSDIGVSPKARRVWDAFSARGVIVQKDQGGHYATISAEDVQRVDIDAFNRGRLTKTRTRISQRG